MIFFTIVGVLFVANTIATYMFLVRVANSDRSDWFASIIKSIYNL